MNYAVPFMRKIKQINVIAIFFPHLTTKKQRNCKPEFLIKKIINLKIKLKKPMKKVERSKTKFVPVDREKKNISNISKPL